MCKGSAVGKLGRYCARMGPIRQPDAVPTEAAHPSKKRWSDLSPAARLAIVLGGVAEVVITSIAVRDLMRRPRATVRGGRVPWLLAFFVQPIGPLAYLVVGRRETND